MPKKETAHGGRLTSAAPAKSGRPKPQQRAGKPAQAVPKPSRPAGKATRAEPPKQTAKTDPKASASKARARKTANTRGAIGKHETTAQHFAAWSASIRHNLKDPAFWQRMRSHLPPWADELGALLLIVAGVIALTALFNSTSEAALAVALSTGLRRLFGVGAFVVALGVLATGVALLLPKFGIQPRFGWLRVVAFEIAFAAWTALLHIAANDPEPRVLASEGGGGGYLGWALSELGLGLGRTAAVLLFTVLLLAGLILATGLRGRHVLRANVWLQGRVRAALDRLNAPPDDPRLAAPEQPGAGPLDRPDLPGGARIPYSRPSIVPRENGEAESPALPDRWTAPIKPPEPGAGAPPSPDARRKSNGSGGGLSKSERMRLIADLRDSMGASNGRSLVAPGEPGERPSIVPRLPEVNSRPASSGSPAAASQIEPGERYFTVADFQDAKKIGERDPLLPPLDLLSDTELNKPTEEEVNTNARIIKNTLLDFDVEVEVIDVKVGPTVTQYAVSPYTESVSADGETVLNRVRVSQIANLNGDLALALSAKRLRIQAPVPGHAYVGVEVPNRQPSTVALRPVIESEAYYRKRERPLALPLGRDVSGEPFVADLATMPHLLIAGTTGSGKSIMLAAMTASFVLNNSPERLKLVLLDPKMVELSRFNGLPHLLGPVETELDRIIEVLRWATREMDRRYKLLEQEAARNIEIYNRALGKRRQSEHLPYIVIIIDEIGDLMMQRPDETERALTRLAQMARAVGMHLMVATQRPSVDVITGLIKANFPARVSFAVASSVDSRVILDHGGAESLMGRGDMLFLGPDAAGPRRLQGCYISDEEVNAVVEYWARWHEDALRDGRAEPRGMPPWERGLTRREVLSETDPMLEEAIAVVIAEQEASASLIQRRLGLGYPRAARIMDLLHQLGIIGEATSGGRTREVLVKPGADPFRKIVDQRLEDKD